MAGRIYKVAVTCGAKLREIGSSMLGMMPQLRSADGTFGTQHMQAQERAAHRKKDYPGS